MYIYIYRERGRDTHTYIYIYTYREREGVERESKIYRQTKRMKERERAREIHLERERERYIYICIYIYEFLYLCKFGYCDAGSAGLGWFTRPTQAAINNFFSPKASSPGPQAAIAKALLRPSTVDLLSREQLMRCNTTDSEREPAVSASPASHCPVQCPRHPCASKRPQCLGCPCASKRPH